MKTGTLCFLVKDNSILLGMKKRGFGEGKWNGFGGKIAAGETVAAAALRELDEEIGVRGDEESLAPMGVLKFRSVNPAMNWDVHLFFLHEWSGEPTESEEMRPMWHKKDAIPYEAMWSDDILWLPHLLAGNRIE